MWTLLQNIRSMPPPSGTISSSLQGVIITELGHRGHSILPTNHPSPPPVITIKTTEKEQDLNWGPQCPPAGWLLVCFSAVVLFSCHLIRPICTVSPWQVATPLQNPGRWLSSYSVYWPGNREGQKKSKTSITFPGEARRCLVHGFPLRWLPDYAREAPSPFLSFPNTRGCPSGTSNHVL